MKIRWLAVAGLGAILATLAVAPVSGASISGPAGITGETITDGTVDLAATLASSALAVPNIVPGAKVTAPITVSNTGTLGQWYSVKSVTTGSATLAAQLELTIKVGVTSCNNAGFGHSGTALYTAGDLGSAAGTSVMGDSAFGKQAGDRTLASGASEMLCAQVVLPSGTGNEFQSLTTTATLNFNAEQMMNTHT